MLKEEKIIYSVLFAEKKQQIPNAGRPLQIKPQDSKPKYFSAHTERN